MAISKQTLALAVAGLAPLTWIGVSAATEADDPVLSDQVEVVEDAVPTTETTETTVATEGDDADDADELEAADAPAAEHPENHGKYVSEAAHTCPKGPGHGECVRAVAQSDAGKVAESDDGTDDASLDADGPEGDESEASDDADEPDEDEAEGSTTEDSGPGASGGRSAGHGKGHAKG